MPDIGYVVAITVSDAAPATTPTNALGGLISFTPPNISRDVIDITNTASPNLAREFMGGFADYGNVTFGILWDTGSSVDVLIRSMVTERLPRTWRMTFNQYSPARTITFSAVLTGYDRETPMDDKMTAVITLKVSGVAVAA